MKMLHPLSVLKFELKELSNKIKIERSMMKNLFRENKIFEGSIKHGELNSISQKYRYRHIVYCELRGTERIKIENPHVDNKPNEHYIKSLKEEYIKNIRDFENETVCACS